MAYFVCGGCGKQWAAVNASFCPHCGTRYGGAAASPDVARTVMAPAPPMPAAAPAPRRQPQPAPRPHFSQPQPVQKVVTATPERAVHCVSCRELVDMRWKTCPYCGKKWPGMTPAVKFGIGSLAAVVLVGTCVAIVSPSHPARAPSYGTTEFKMREAPRPAPAVAIDALDLWDAYQENEVSADEEYKGKRLRVLGRVDSIDKDFMDNIVIKFRTRNEFMPIHAKMADGQRGAGRLSKGQSLGLTCIGEGMLIGTPMLGDCTF